MKLFFTFIVLLSLLLSSFSDCIILMMFTLNRDYIAANLCEQRTQAGNSCRGCCQLWKQLKSEDRRDQAPPARDLKDRNDIQSIPVEVIPVPPTRSTGTVCFHPVQSFAPDPPNRDIDHPPESSPLAAA